MSYRYMRVLVLFDLPMNTSAQVREYNQFRKYLIRNGFMMMQKSVYCKLALNLTAVNAIVENLRRNHPDEGLVQVLTLTEKQFSKIEFIVGESYSEVLDSDQKMVVL